METASARPLTASGAVGPAGWKESVFARLLSKLRGGSVELRMPSGASLVVGEEGTTPLVLTVLDAAFFGKVLSGGSVGFGEAYVDGLWTTPDLTALLALLGRNQRDLGRLGRGFSLLARSFNRMYHRARRNTREQSGENIREHYDLSNAFYATFLDPSMTYSSGLFLSPDDALEQAQANKMTRILDLAGVTQGSRVLEIGSGWGSLALRAAGRGASVRTVTLSEEQFSYAREAFADAGLAGQVEIVLQDYRSLRGEFDAVLSCEMIEAVGHDFLGEYFEVIRRSLRPGGRAVIQAITIPDDRYERYRRSCDWIQKHIFPGGHLPSPGALERAITDAGELSILQMTGFGADYARTLRLWRERFNEAREKVLSLGFDEPFCRKWNYYLSYCEAGFSEGLIDVQHLVLQRPG